MSTQTSHGQGARVHFRLRGVTPSLHKLAKLFSELKTWVHMLFDICVLYSGRTLWKFWLNFSGFYLNIVPDAIRMRFANVLVLSFILALANSAGNECDKADKECISEHEKSKYSKGKSNYRKLFWCGSQTTTKMYIYIYVCDKLFYPIYSLVSFFCFR